MYNNNSQPSCFFFMFLILVLFDSFKPQNGIVNSVKVYVSDYGKDRLTKEEVEGPAELVDKTNDDGPGTREGNDPDLIEVNSSVHAAIN